MTTPPRVLPVPESLIPTVSPPELQALFWQQLKPVCSFSNTCSTSFIVPPQRAAPAEVWGFGLSQFRGRVCVWVLCAVCLSPSVVSDSLQPHGMQPARLLCPWGFSKQVYQSGLPCPPPRDLPNPMIKPKSPTVLAGSLLSEPPGKPKVWVHWHLMKRHQRCC